MATSKIVITTEYNDPAERSLEIVERKGIGHPDTLADGLAEAISIEYSKACLQRFGQVLHHNIDKLYIGGGMTERDYGSFTVKEPIRVVVNGRMSDRFGKQQIDVRAIQIQAATNYLAKILPRIDLERDIIIEPNASQKSAWTRWFRPESIQDLPEATQLKANDTSMCVASFPFTTAETLAYNLEHWFWTVHNDTIAYRYADVGQDIKIMVVRSGQDYDITACVPLLADHIASHTAYRRRIAAIQQELNEYAHSLAPDAHSIKLVINTNTNVPYLLGLGTCAENGEEGLVGRGNALNGIIAAFRPHSVEAFPGKNPRYHTGRVIGAFTSRLAEQLFAATGSPCTVIGLTRIGEGLLPPHLLTVQTQYPVDKSVIQGIIKGALDKDYLGDLLQHHFVLQEGSSAWHPTLAPSTPVDRP